MIFDKELPLANQSFFQTNTDFPCILPTCQIKKKNYASAVTNAEGTQNWDTF